MAKENLLDFTHCMHYLIVPNDNRSEVIFAVLYLKKNYHILIINSTAVVIYINLLFTKN